MRVAIVAAVLCVAAWQCAAAQAGVRIEYTATCTSDCRAVALNVYDDAARETTVQGLCSLSPTGCGAQIPNVTVTYGPVTTTQQTGTLVDDNPSANRRLAVGVASSPGQSPAHVALRLTDVDGTVQDLAVDTTGATNECFTPGSTPTGSLTLEVVSSPGGGCGFRVAGSTGSPATTPTLPTTVTSPTLGTTQLPPGAPQPQFGTSVDLAVVSGTVLFRAPGTTRFVPLATVRAIPLGSVIDVRHGRVRLYSIDPKGVLQAADFYEGEFKVFQRRALKGLTDLVLFGGNFARCGSRRGGRTAIGLSIRHLWGQGAGNFRTQGRYAATSIRGTTWLVDDRCDGTLTVVTRGSVTVRDLVRKVSVVLVAPKRYFARARRRA